MTAEVTTSIELAPSKLRQTLSALRLCAPEAQQQMQLSLSRLGQLTPVQAYRVGDSLELFDGLERLMRNAETDSALEQGWLLRELRSRFGLSLVEVGKHFDKSPASRRLSLMLELSESIQEHVRADQLQATQR